MVHYGSSVFEGERAYGGNIFLSQKHSQRLHKSADLMDMVIPWSVEQIEAAKYEVLKVNGLSDAYVRAVAFRGAGAEVLLPPTRSLVQAKRRLAALPGGGGTPLAAGLEAGLALADRLRSRGVAPFLVILTDGRANVARDGVQGHGPGAEDAMITVGSSTPFGLVFSNQFRQLWVTDGTVSGTVEIALPWKVLAQAAGRSTPPRRRPPRRWHPPPGRRRRPGRACPR